MNGVRLNRRERVERSAALRLELPELLDTRLPSATRSVRAAVTAVVELLQLLDDDVLPLLEGAGILLLAVLLQRAFRALTSRRSSASRSFSHSEASRLPWRSVLQVLIDVRLREPVRHPRRKLGSGDLVA